jgi:hypothetical protein
MSPAAIYISDGEIAVLWSSRGPFTILREDGSISEQFREPQGRRIWLLDADEPIEVARTA